MTYIKAFLEANEMLGLKLTSLAVDEMSPEQFHLYQAARLAAPEIAELVERNILLERKCRVVTRWFDGRAEPVPHHVWNAADRIREIVGE